MKKCSDESVPLFKLTKMKPLEIFEKHLAQYLLKPQDIYHGTEVIPEIIRRAMEEYAKQKAIKFATNYAETAIMFGVSPDKVADDRLEERYDQMQILNKL